MFWEITAACLGTEPPSPAGAEDINILSAAIQLVIMLPCIPIAYGIYKRTGKKNLQNYNNPDFAALKNICLVLEAVTLS